LPISRQLSQPSPMDIRKAALTTCCRGTSSRQAKLTVLSSDRLQNSTLRADLGSCALQSSVDRWPRDSEQFCQIADGIVTGGMHTRHYTVLFDANVLYPTPMRDALLQLAVTDLFKAKWTADIHREWIAALLRNEPHREWAALERTRDLMDRAKPVRRTTNSQPGPLIPREDERVLWLVGNRCRRYAGFHPAPR